MGMDFVPTVANQYNLSSHRWKGSADFIWNAKEDCPNFIADLSGDNFVDINPFEFVY